MGMSAELEKLQGSWKVVTLEVEGREVAAGFFGGAKIVVDGEKFSTVGMGADYAGRITVDVVSEPKRFDVLFSDVPHAGLASLGIYELKGISGRFVWGLRGRSGRRGSQRRREAGMRWRGLSEKLERRSPRNSL